MTCPGCQEAETNPKNWQIFYGQCKSCDARSLLRYEATEEAMRLKEMTPIYRRTLQRVFGSDWERGHRLVKEWHEKLNGGENAA